MPCSKEIEDFIKHLDKDGSGTIDAKELLSGLNCDEICLDQVRAFIRKIDKNGDGKLDLAELMVFFDSTDLSC
nr:calmodulin protein [Hymenolepis microstoma]